jgi:hypothetical protein
MLIRLLGLVNVESIEARVDESKHNSMVAALPSLKTQRTRLIHT